MGAEPVADIRVRSSRLRGIDVDPALVSLAIVAAIFAAGITLSIVRDEPEPPAPEPEPDPADFEDVYVEPSVRGKGLGKALLIEVIKIATARECRRSDWLVLDWNKRAKQFYESLGAEILSDWRLCRMDEAAMRRLAAGGHKKGTPLPNSRRESK